MWVYPHSHYEHPLRVCLIKRLHPRQTESWASRTLERTKGLTVAKSKYLNITSETPPPNLYHCDRTLRTLYIWSVDPIVPPTSIPHLPERHTDSRHPLHSYTPSPLSCYATRRYTFLPTTLDSSSTKECVLAHQTLNSASKSERGSVCFAVLKEKEWTLSTHPYLCRNIAHR